MAPGGRAGRQVAPVGGELGESKLRLDGGLYEVNELSSYDGLKRCAHNSKLFSNARWPDLTGSCAPEAGHLADSTRQRKEPSREGRTNMNPRFGHVVWPQTSAKPTQDLLTSDFEQCFRLCGGARASFEKDT